MGIALGDLVKSRVCAQGFQLEGGSEVIRGQPCLFPPEMCCLDFYWRKCKKTREEFQFTEHLLCVSLCLLLHIFDVIEFLQKL